ncbi:MAG: pilus (MSHA type) biogenesis protein MshL [Pseudomonadales bacterium]
MCTSLLKPRFALLLVPLFLAGCQILRAGPALQTDSADQVQDFLDEAVATASNAEEESETAAAVASESLDGRGDAPGLAAADESELAFDLVVDDVPVSAFFQALVADTDYNVVVHPGVKGNVSLDLDSITIREVMNIMRTVYGFDSVLNGNTYQIYPDVLRTEIFQVDYLNIARTGHSEMQVSAGKVTDSGGGNSDSSSGEYNDQSSSGGNSGSSVVGTIVNTDASSDFWVELEITLNAIITGDEGAQVVVTPQAGLVVVRAKPDSLSAIRTYLSQVQSSLHRQVVLEAKILDVTLKGGFQAGINWNTFGEGSGGTFRPRSFVDENGMVVTTLGSDSSAAGEFNFGDSGDFFNPTGSGFTFFADFGDFSAVIDLLQTQGVVQVLSSPRIATVNNQKAVIKVGDDEFFVTDISTNTVTAGSAINTNDSPELTPFFSGIALDVTPQISAAGDVILHVHPTVSQVREQIKVISGEPVPLAASTIRESDSVIRAKSGQIVIIGGLMQNTSNDENGEVPGLARLPLAGNLFRQRVQGSIKSELVILLRPLVVNSNQQSELFKDSADRIEDLRQKIGSKR